MKASFTVLAIVAVAALLSSAAPIRVHPGADTDTLRRKVQNGLVTTAQQTNNATVPLQPNTVTISGVSAGAAMVIQYQFAHSSTIRAAGIIAGLPFYCAELDLIVGAYACMDDPETISLDTLMVEARAAESAGLLDPLSNIKDQFMMLWSGTKDTVVAHGSMILVDEMYTKHLGVNRSQTVAVFNYSAEHAWVTNFYGNQCDYLGSPYLNNCVYDFAGQFLSRSWASMGLESQWNSTPGVYSSSNMHEIDMATFGASSLIGLDTVGYLYIPTSCKGSGTGSSPLVSPSCALHVNFHGCEQARTMLTPHDRYVSHTGLNEYAETNSIVVFYPQVIPTSVVPYNPKGCFDWWGYVSPDYSTKDSAQIQVIHAAITWLLNQ